MALRPISRLDDYAFPEDAWDVRGWKVRTEEDDAKVGRVEDMLLGHGGGLRYLDVDLGFLKKHVLVPLDHAHADRETETVWIEGMHKDRLEEVPEYALDPESLDEGYERRLDAHYGGTVASRHRDLVAPREADGELELRRMETLEDEYQVATEDPRGWKVVTGEGETVGRVAGLLVEPGAMKARFLDVVVDEERLGLEPVDRHVILPAERVRMDRKGSRVLASGLLASDMETYPQYSGLPVTHEAVRALNGFLDRVGSPARREEDRRAADAEIVDERDDGSDWTRTTLRHFYGTHSRTHRAPVREED
jgi:ribosomal 30S subunit maturation factor RimM